LFGRIRHPRRQQEWLAVRVLAKYLLLSGASPSTAIRLVGVGHLLSIPACEYRELDVLPGRHGVPEMRRRGALAVHTLSLSHAAGWAVAALASEGEIGTDCELVEARRPAFFSGNFVDAEHDWVGRHSAPGGPGADYLYTLLWSLKEAASKTGRVAGRCGTDIHLHANGALSAAARRCFIVPSRELIPLDLRISDLAPYFAFTALSRCILTVVHFPACASEYEGDAPWNRPQLEFSKSLPI